MQTIMEFYANENAQNLKGKTERLDNGQGEFTHALAMLDCQKLHDSIDFDRNAGTPMEWKASPLGHYR